MVGGAASESRGRARKVCLFSTMRTRGGAVEKSCAAWERGTSISDSAGAWLR